MRGRFAIPTALAVLAVAAVAEAGAIPGQKVATDAVDAYSTDVYHIAFEAGSPAVVLVSGDGDTDLDLLVYDEAGNLVAGDDDATDDCVAAWAPYCTGVFTIKVKNLGCVYNRYAMATN